MKQSSNTSKALRGAMTAIITPFLESGDVDIVALEKLAAWQVEQGIDALVPCGTTGEGATLNAEEHSQVISAVVRAVAGRVPVIAGCGSNDTRKTVDGAQRAADAGADALLVVTPYYNKPNRSGMIAHYETVARAVELPLVVYNVPGRTGQNLGAELIVRLAEISGIVAVKEAAGDLEQLGAIIEKRPPGFSVLSGDDALTVPALSIGADGVISVVANEAPRLMSEMVAAGLAGDFATARKLHYRLLPLMRANFVETNPVPVKTAMALLGHCADHLRPPLGPIDERAKQLLERVLAESQL